MARVVNLVDYLPQVLKVIREFKVISDAASPEVTLCHDDIKDLFDDQFIMDATETGIKRWENILKIKPKNTNTLEDRRFRVLARLNSTLPYTFIGLRDQLAGLCGFDGFTIDMQEDIYKLIVRIALDAKEQFNEVKSILEKQVPANIIVDLDLLYNTHELLAPYTHAELSAYTHKQLREEDIF